MSPREYFHPWASFVAEHPVMVHSKEIVSILLAVWSTKL